MTPIGLLWRAGLITISLFAFYNPTEYNFVTQAYRALEANQSAAMWLTVAAIAACFFVVFGYLIKQAHNSIGKIGAAMLIALMVLIVLAVAFSFNLPLRGRAIVWVSEACLSLLLFFALIYPALNRRISGQVTTQQAAGIDAHIHHG